MSIDSTRFFELFFARLEAEGIPSVVLHSYETMPEKVASDIDYAVLDRDLMRAQALLVRLADEWGWVVAQRLQHQVFAFYNVVIDPENPSEHLKLDVCSHYVKDRCKLIQDRVLLENRRSFRGFHIPAPAVEFLYVLAKVFAKNKSPASYVQRLRELYAMDPEGAERRFAALFGLNAGKAAEWLETPPEHWGNLDKRMRARNRYGLPMLAREACRLATRVTNPTGFHLALLGPDGAGKSTLLSHLEILLEPCFRRQKVFHFRPMMFEKPSRGVVNEPHAQPPRSRAASLLKIIYYFVDHLLGWLLKVLPLRQRTTLVVFDRTFDDLLVDRRRYRIQGGLILARALRCLLPKADLTVILEGDPEVIHARKPELSVDELGRQRKALRALVAQLKSAAVISVEQSPEEIARAVSACVIRLLAKRTLSRARRWMTYEATGC